HCPTRSRPFLRPYAPTSKLTAQTSRKENRHVRVHASRKLQGRRGQAVAASEEGQARQDFPYLSMESREEGQPDVGHIRNRSRSLRAHGTRRLGQDQRPDRSDAVVPTVLP